MFIASDMCSSGIVHFKSERGIGKCGMNIDIGTKRLDVRKTSPDCEIKHSLVYYTDNLVNHRIYSLL